MKYADDYRHLNKGKNKSPSNRTSKRRNEVREKKSREGFLRIINTVDKYWGATLKDNEIDTIINDWYWYKSDYNNLKEFINKSKEDGYGSLEKARELKINKLID